MEGTGNTEIIDNCHKIRFCYPSLQSSDEEEEERERKTKTSDEQEFLELNSFKAIIKQNLNHERK